MKDRATLERVRRASEEARDWTDASIRLQQGISGEDDPVRPYLIGLTYMLTDRQSASRSRWGPFGPFIEFDNAVSPMPLKDVADDLLVLWEVAAGPDQNDLIRARFADLLWVRKHGGKEAYRYGLAAIEAYRSRGAGEGGIHAVVCLTRAIELAQQLRNDDQIKAAVQDAYDFAAEQAVKDGPPGPAVRMTEVLSELPASLRPPRLRELLEKLSAREESNADLRDAVLALLVKVSTDQADIKKWQEEQVDLWIRAAEDAAQGLLRLVHLERALAIARTYGLTDRIEEARKRLEDMGEEDLDLKTVSAQVNVPTADVEREIENFVGTDGWQQALKRFGARPAPAGDSEDNAARVRDQMRGSIQHLFPKKIIGPGGLPVANIGGEAAHLEAEIKHQEAFAIGIWGTFAVPILDRIRERYGQPTSGDLAAFFTTPIIRAEVAERIGRAVELWWEGQADECAHLLLPRIETVIRDMAQQLGIVVYREPLPSDPGGVQSLGAILAGLQGRIDESWRRHLVNLLTDQLGYNLRNLVLHGLVPRVGKTEACLLVNVACFLRVLEVGEQSEPAEGHKRRQYEGR